MRVNAAFTGFISNWLVVGSGIVIVMLLIFFLPPRPLETFRWRLTGKASEPHYSSDWSSVAAAGRWLYLPCIAVSKINDGTFLLKFENESILTMTRSGYCPRACFQKTVPFRLHRYSTWLHERWHRLWFPANNTTPDILACSGRSEPPGCYTIEFCFSWFLWEHRTRIKLTSTSGVKNLNHLKSILRNSIQNLKN